MKAILDANLLLVLLAGSCDKRSLGQKKFVKDYGADDFNMLREMLSGFGEFFVTPNVFPSARICFADAAGTARTNQRLAF